MITTTSVVLLFQFLQFFFSCSFSTLFNIINPRKFSLLSAFNAVGLSLAYIKLFMLCPISILGCLGGYSQLFHCKVEKKGVGESILSLSNVPFCVLASAHLIIHTLAALCSHCPIYMLLVITCIFKPFLSTLSCVSFVLEGSYHHMLCKRPWSNQ